MRCPVVGADRGYAGRFCRGPRNGRGGRYQRRDRSGFAPRTPTTGRPHSCRPSDAPRDPRRSTGSASTARVRRIWGIEVRTIERLECAPSARLARPGAQGRRESWSAPGGKHRREFAKTTEEAALLARTRIEPGAREQRLRLLVRHGEGNCLRQDWLIPSRCRSYMTVLGKASSECVTMRDRSIPRRNCLSNRHSGALLNPWVSGKAAMEETK